MENGATAQFERALMLYRSGSERLAHQAARVLLDLAPEHVGGMMLLLVTAAGIGDEVTISAALRAVAPRFLRLIAVPEARELLGSDLLAPVASSRTFRTVFAPALRAVEKAGSDAVDRQLAREVQEAVRDASVDEVLRAAPAFRAQASAPAGRALCLVDASTRALVAEVREGRLYLVGRGSDADVHLDHTSVSRAHLQLGLRGGAWFVQNLSRTNGTILNGKPLGGEWASFGEGDELQLGDVILDVLAPGQDFGPARAPAYPEPFPPPRSYAETSRVSLFAADGAKTDPNLGDLLDTGKREVLRGGNTTPA